MLTELVDTANVDKLMALSFRFICWLDSLHHPETGKKSYMICSRIRYADMTCLKRADMTLVLHVYVAFYLQQLV